MTEFFHTPFHKQSPEHSISWKFSLYYIFRMAWDFLTKFWWSDLSFSRSILTSLYLKNFKYLHMSKLWLFVTTYYQRYYYLQISWHDLNLKFTLGILFDKWNWLLILSTWSRDSYVTYTIKEYYILVCKSYTVLLPHLLRPTLNWCRGWHFK